MKYNRMALRGMLAAISMGILILDARTAMEGARDGIQLCLSTVIPSLFPLFILSGFLTKIITGRKLPLLHYLGKICKIPPGAESIFLVGLLGGYPVGAQTVAAACRGGQLSIEDGRRMLGFCSNAGPAFIFGMVGSAFAYRPAPWLLWLIHIFSAILTGIMLPGTRCQNVTISQEKEPTFSQAINSATKIMAQVCSWVIVFRVIIAFCQRWFLWTLPDALCAVFCGFLELSNGCCMLYLIENMGLRFVAAAAMLGFGGLCVSMQTVSVTGGKLGSGLYFPGKCLQCLLSILLAWVVQFWLFPDGNNLYFPPIIIASGLLFCIFLLIILKNTVAFSGKLVYNQEK